ncbi:hypothetical protein SAMN05216275_14162 [Streptosporangium canum]|uniref:Major capsid protein n=1 Tax=Streptosporangium canum TaxID=324952 RepID=A0A1I4DHA1_9ACTN|nr:hypothetical protein [Streptosporangium canum]SFK92585.1 hypothetical protein SAMN05216275_14162 [Streptosporangium canum]
MPGSYPAAPPSLSGDLLSISRLLQSPTQINRRLRTFADLRFVSDQILKQRFRSTGGAVMYQVSEPILNSRPVEAVGPGSEYPLDTPQTGAAAVAAVQKWGQKIFMSDEEILRNVFAGAAVDRNLRKTVNSIIKQVDSITLSAVASAVTATSAAVGVWASATTILRDIEKAKAAIYDLNAGYNPDTLLMSSNKYALMASDPTIATLRRREDTNNPVYSGQIDILDDLTVVVAPLSSMPGGSDDVWVFDTEQLGGMADETDSAPGYTVTDMAIQVQSQRIAERDGWEMWGRRKTVPVIQEPSAGIKITGT